MGVGGRRDVDDVDAAQQFLERIYDVSAVFSDQFGGSAFGVNPDLCSEREEIRQVVASDGSGPDKADS